MKARNSVGSSDGLPARHVDAFLDRLRAARYSEVTLGKKRRVLAAFSLWMKSQNIDLAHLDESDAALFMKRLSNAPAPRVQFELAVLRLFLVYLRNEGIVHLPSVNCQSAVADIHDRYVDYLRQERGLAKNSVLVYGPFIRDFLDCQDVGNGTVLPDAFDAVTIRNHLLARSRGRSGEYMRLMTVSLRSFCHFLFLRGYTPHDLYESVPTVRKCRQSSVPTFLTPEQEEVIIASTDRSTPRGRRDYAILLLLARLGLRAGEIVALELGDIRWRSGELVIHGKGRMVEHVPLLSDVGEALASYLQTDRGTSASRRVFLRMWAPRVGLTGPAPCVRLLVVCLS
ncbi:tyrosine-type recombinase/integrase [Paraburkholderia aspalathi]|uniref:tyrosine-type recombinase/integrase n=1 Tax=Paraburkholderia aspalathi TaxID=1324617 RepID=UPI001B204EA4|nr:tyrosine-type recombinase/integrase [Paraburkholderia aspalathi]CAE6840546.1 Tyrosine recombinase XerC [Paraburkholderia aspalathi]